MSIPNKIALINDAFDHIFEDIAHALTDLSETLSDAQKARELLERFEDCLECKDCKKCLRTLNSLEEALQRDFDDAEHVIEDLRHVEADIEKALAVIRRVKCRDDKKKDDKKKDEKKSDKKRYEKKSESESESKDDEKKRYEKKSESESESKDDKKRCCPDLGFESDKKKDFDEEFNLRADKSWWNDY